MVDAVSLRARVLTILGAGFVVLGPGCGGTSEQSGEGNPVQGGQQSSAGAAPVGRGGGGTGGSGGGGAAGSGGTVASLPPTCDVVNRCLTPAELARFRIGGSAGEASSGVGGEA